MKLVHDGVPVGDVLPGQIHARRLGHGDRLAHGRFHDRLRFRVRLEDSVRRAQHGGCLVDPDVDHQLPPHRPDHVHRRLVGDGGPVKEGLQASDALRKRRVVRLAEDHRADLAEANHVAVPLGVDADRVGVQHALLAVAGGNDRLAVQPVHDREEQRFRARAVAEVIEGIREVVVLEGHNDQIGGRGRVIRGQNRDRVMAAVDHHAASLEPLVARPAGGESHAGRVHRVKGAGIRRSHRAGAEEDDSLDLFHKQPLCGKVAVTRSRCS